ncbi:MAG: response regulator [Campylobacterales bacterium]|nr:response regulator [Campylobacterales bacterium]
MFEEKYNILIIDDNPKNIQLAANVLRSSSRYKIFFATDGKSGIAQLGIRDYALILLDINMPELSGYETADFIKKDPKFKKIPIIFLSANADKESIRKGFEHGGEDYITKPFDELELLHRVKTHVELFLAKEKLQAEVDETKVLLEQYKVAVDSTSLVSKTDKYGIITYVNDEFCRISGYTREELIRHSHNMIRSPNMKSLFFKELWETISSKKIWRGLIENRTKDGHPYFVDTTILPILDINNEILEYISIRTNITSEVQLREDVVSTQKEILHTFGELGEWRSQETGEHVNRVSLFSEVLARAYGWKIFHQSKHALLQAAATISHEHHEKWDGTGYPRGLSGEQIHIYGRITAICDVFDALSHDRVYKKAWSVEETIAFLQAERGKAFEPKLVDLFIENLDEILEIKRQHQN